MSYVSELIRNYRKATQYEKERADKAEHRWEKLKNRLPTIKQGNHTDKNGVKKQEYIWYDDGIDMVIDIMQELECE